MQALKTRPNAPPSMPMTGAPDLITPPAGGRWLHLSLFAMQTIGAVILYWKGLPAYRLLEADPAAYGNHDLRVWSLPAIALIQVGYWVRYRIGPEPTQLVSTALGHIVLFLSQLVFTLPAAVFSLMSLSRGNWHRKSRRLAMPS